MDLEKAVRNRVEASGGRMMDLGACRPARFPQYLIILPGGHIGFVEIGMPDGYLPLKILKERIMDLRALGCAACVVDDASQINRMMMYILSDAGKDASWNAYQDCVKGMRPHDI